MGYLNLKKIIVGSAVAVAISVILLLVLTFAVFYSDFDEGTVSALIVGISAVSVVFGSFILARNIENGGLLNGLVLGGLYCCVLLAISFVLNGSVAFDWGNVSRLIVILAAGMLGGVVGINSVK